MFDIQTKEKGRNYLISTLNQKIKRKQNTIIRLKSLLRAEINKFIKRKKSLVENILGIHVKDLEKELDILKDQVDENSNNIQSNMFETRLHGKGKPYNAKLRSCIKFFTQSPNWNRAYCPYH